MQCCSWCKCKIRDPVEIWVARPGYYDQNCFPGEVFGRSCCGSRARASAILRLQKFHGDLLDWWEIKTFFV